MRIQLYSGIFWLHDEMILSVTYERPPGLNKLQMHCTTLVLNQLSCLLHTSKVFQFNYSVFPVMDWEIILIQCLVSIMSFQRDFDGNFFISRCIVILLKALTQRTKLGLVFFSCKWN